ncbi:hypothetical protein NUW58_g5391 [Xylaria curta]|uniref:Uncharacterized protein n=1 Tax=Xylaria curta TaxID=42375 RepID=A0ACC1P1X6_9PEZI|nr:hypothetical protein NUW58_g5391 [Xylaria curta]
MGQRRGADPLHWMLVLKNPSKDRGTWYHVIGERGVYEVAIQNGECFRSHEISEHYFICDFSERDQSELKSACLRAKLARSQEWTTAVLGDLENRGRVPPGTHSYWFGQIELSRWSTDGVHRLKRPTLSRSTPQQDIGNIRLQSSSISQPRYRGSAS